MPEKILVVDDDIDSLKLIGLMLQRQGYEVMAATTGNQAMQKATSDIPDLIILDVMMPDMDGYEVCRRLRANPNTQPVPIIMFTAKTLIDDKVAGFEAGADDYLTKPTHPAELAARVRQILDRTSANRAAKPSAQNTTVGVIGAKGGVGTTTITVNMGAALAQGGAKPIVADFRPGSGNMSLMLGFESVNGMANVLSRPLSDIRPALVERELVSHASGLRALLSSTRPREAQLNINPEGAETVVEAIRSLTSRSVFDLGTGYSPLNQRLLAHMDNIIMLVEPIRLTLQMAQGLLQEIENDLRKPVSIVVVTRSQSKLQIAWHEVEAMLGREILAIVSPAPELAFQAQEAQMPMVLYQPNAIVSSQIAKLAADVKA
jgi:CheY-like chemotaxis protein/MinD-like ATPase involved in chromosome partitioning or flagellar assembly